MIIKLNTKLKILLSLASLIIILTLLATIIHNNSFISKALANEIEWTKVQIPADMVQILNIDCPENGDILCLATGHTWTGNKLLVTPDGLNWQYKNDFPGNFQIISLDCPKTESIFCIAAAFNSGTPSILIADNTLNWNEVPNIDPDTVYEDILCPQLDGLFCITVGHSNDGKAVIMTTENGADWINAEGLPEGTNDYPAFLGTVSCPDTETVKCMAFGNLNGESLFLTTVNGQGWMVQPDFPDYHIHDVSCPKSNGVLCIAAGINFNNDGVILKTSDGINWTEVPGMPSNANFTSIECPGLPGNFCTAVGGNYVANTVDGNNWTADTFYSDYLGSRSLVCPNSDKVYCLFAGNEFIMDYKANIFAALVPVISVPTDKEQCKKGGWKNFSELNFKNQGDCVSYVSTNGKNSPNIKSK